MTDLSRYTNGAYAIPEIQWDEERDEPFCAIEIKGEQYLLTMWRESDGDDMVRNWDHPLVGKWSFKRPYPFTHAHLPTTFDLFLKPDREAIESYRSYISGPPDAQKEKPKRYLFRALRTKEGKMIGNTDMFSFIDEETGKEKWEIAYDLDPDYWGKGLGKWMIGFLVNWAGWIGTDTITAKVATANTASQGVLLANGFEKQWTRVANMPEDKGGYESEFSEWAKKL